MNRIEFDDVFKSELEQCQWTEAQSENEKQAVVRRAIGNLRKHYSKQELTEVFNPNREMSAEELNYVSGGSGVLSEVVDVVDFAAHHKRIDKLAIESAEDWVKDEIDKLI